MRPVSGEARRTVLIWSLGTLALLAVMVWGVWLAFQSWWSHTGRQVAVESVVGPRTAGVVVFSTRPGDEGLQALADLAARQMVEVARARGQELPPFAPQMMARAGQQVVPAEAAVAFDWPSGGQAPSPVAAVNFPGYARLMAMLSTRLLAGSALSSELQTERYLGYELMGPGPVLCLRNGTMLVAHDRDAMVALLDRLEKGETLPSSPPLPSVLEPPPGGWEMHGTFVPKGGMLEWLLEDAEAAGRVEFLEFGADLVSEDEMHAVVLTRCRSRDGAGRVASSLGRLLDRMAAPLRDSNLKVRHTTTGQGRDLRSEVRVLGVEGAVEAWFEELKAGKAVF